MKKHRKLEARKRIDESLTHLHKDQIDHGQLALQKHLAVLEKEFIGYAKTEKQKRKLKKIAVS